VGFRFAGISGRLLPSHVPSFLERHPLPFALNEMKELKKEGHYLHTDAEVSATIGRELCRWQSGRGISAKRLIDLLRIGRQGCDKGFDFFRT
jgi:hypothetical protein